MAYLNELLEAKRTLVCVGPGGVGKTTTSAALGLIGASQGRRTLVLTVDPAQRLANALGFDSFDTEEQRVAVPPELVPGKDVHFYAMMLNTKNTFDGVIKKYAPSAEVRDRILSSPFYIQAATRLAGSQEYMAMEKLYEIHTSGRFDQIILDTPPTAHALDFLEAPNRLEDFMNTSTEGLLAKSSRTLGKFGLSFLRANAVVVKGVSKFLGTELFIEILNFLNDFSEMYTGFKDRAGKVKSLMRSRDVGFVILTNPERTSVDEGLFFHRRLTAEKMSPAAFIMNRVRTVSATVDESLAEDLAADIQAGPAGNGHPPATISAMTQAIAKAAKQYEILARKDALEIERLQRMLGQSIPAVIVPDFSKDLHDLMDLLQFGKHLVSA